MIIFNIMLSTHPTYLDNQSGQLFVDFSLHGFYRFDDPGCVRRGEVRYKHFESCSPIGLYSAELSILWTPYLPTSLPHLPTHFWNGRAVCSAAAAGWLASQFPVGRLSRRLVQKRASPELPSIVCIQGGMIYTTLTSLYTQQYNFIFKTGTFIRAIKKNTSAS